jgi:hypothetical protein
VHLYRILKHFEAGVTMVFEEFNLNDSSADAREYVDMLNAGNQQGTFVPRMAGHQFSEIEWLPLFSPKVLTTTDDFMNAGLVRRCFSARVGQLPIPDEKRFEALPDEFYRRCAELRCRLLGWRFSKYGQPANAAASRHRGDLDIGVWQNYYPTIAMIPDARQDAIDMVLELAQGQAHDLSTAQGTHPTVRVLEAAVFVAGGGEQRNREHNRAWSQDILAHLAEFDPRGQWNLEVVRRHMRATGLALQRSSKSIDGHKKYDYYVAVDDGFHRCLEANGLDAGAAPASGVADAAKGVM